MHIPQAAERGDRDKYNTRGVGVGKVQPTTRMRLRGKPWGAAPDGWGECKRKNRVSTNGEYKKKKKSGEQGEEIQYGFGGARRVISYGTEWGAGQTGR